MRRELQLTVEPVQPHHRSLRRCYGCGEYVRPFVEMEGVIRCERCAKRDQGRDGEQEDVSAIDEYGLIG